MINSRIHVHRTIKRVPIASGSILPISPSQEQHSFGEWWLWTRKTRRDGARVPSGGHKSCETLYSSCNSDTTCRFDASNEGEGSTKHTGWRGCTLRRKSAGRHSRMWELESSTRGKMLSRVSERRITILTPPICTTSAGEPRNLKQVREERRCHKTQLPSPCSRCRLSLQLKTQLCPTQGTSILVLPCKAHARKFSLFQPSL